MRCLSVCLILGVICAGLYSVSAHSTEKAFGPFGSKRFSPETPEPINIVSSKAKKIVTTPLKMVIDFTNKVRLINSGRTVEIILISPKTSTFAFGGVLGGDIYIASRAKFIFSNETGGIAGTTVDGKHGTRLEVHIHFYNIKYGTFENALNFRDGIFKIVSRVIVGGSVPNPLFSPFVPYLKQVRHPGNSVEMSVIPAVLFFIVIPFNIQYYAFPGSYTNETTGKQYYSTITIVKEIVPNRYITEQQFDDTFGRLLNENGGKLCTASETLHAGDRPIVSTRRIAEIPAFFSAFPVKPGGV